MSELLPTISAPRLIQNPGRVSRTAIDRLDHLLVILPERPQTSHWRQLPEGLRLQAAARRAGADAIVQGRMSNRRATGISVMRLRVSPDHSFPLLKQLGELLAQALQDQPKNLGLLLPGADAETAAKLAEAALLATHAQCFRMPKFTSKADKRKPLKRLRLIGLPERLDLSACETAARAQNLARWLSCTAAKSAQCGRLSPDAVSIKWPSDPWLATEISTMRSALRKLGAGAFLAVSQGNAGRDAGIVKLSYRPDGAKAGEDATALVGKGILFDTGGNNLKPHKSMLDMHEDMAGSAVALATLQALTETGYPRPVDCWLAITENRIGAQAYKPRDVVTACNGTSIEIIHTDAEGRMVLADTLALAGREKPRLILDYATLTGTCVYALTERYSGVFTNRDGLGPLLIDAGRRRASGSGASRWMRISTRQSRAVSLTSPNVRSTTMAITFWLRVFSGVLSIPGSRGYISIWPQVTTRAGSVWYRLR